MYSSFDKYLKDDLNKKTVEFNKSTELIKQVKGPDTIIDSECILIDSRHRLLSKFDYPSRFQVKFSPSDVSNGGATINTRFKNVISIRIHEIIMPITAASYPYLILKIPELDTSFYGTSDITSRAYAILIPDYSSAGTVFTNFRVKTSSCNCYKIFKPSINLPSTLTIEIYTPDNVLFGSPEVSIANDNQITFLFQIEYETPNNTISTSIV